MLRRLIALSAAAGALTLAVAGSAAARPVIPANAPAYMCALTECTWWNSSTGVMETKTSGSFTHIIQQVDPSHTQYNYMKEGGSGLCLTVNVQNNYTLFNKTCGNELGQAFQISNDGGDYWIIYTPLLDSGCWAAIGNGDDIVTNAVCTNHDTEVWYWDDGSGA